MSYLKGWEYFRLKTIVTLLRLVVGLTLYLPFRRERGSLQATGTVVHRTKIASRQQGRNIKVDVYVPPGHSPDDRAKPVLVNWHGSGFFIPLHGLDALFCARIAKEAGIFVVDADYRKGPESTYPEPLEDVEDVLQWIQKDTRFDSLRVGLSGFSAGGLLALVAASSLRSDSEALVDLSIPIVVAIYPVTDASIPPASKKAPKPVKPGSPFMGNLINDCWAPESLRRHPHVSPGLADPSTFPDTVVIVTCDEDLYAPEADDLARRLHDGKRKVVHKSLLNIHHGFDKGVKEGTKEWDRKEEAYTIVVNNLKQAFGVA